MRLAPEAQDDLRDLLQHSLQAWGRPQRDAFQAAIRLRLSELADYPRLGRAREDLFPGCRNLPIRTYVIYSLIDDEGVFVVRILHERREPSGAVGPPPSN